jgi:fumarate reductase (CoM/CoB) subunit A
MWVKAGLIKNERGLTEGLDLVDGLERKLATLRPQKLRHYVMTKRALTVAKLIIGAALLRRESRGAHFRDDFPFSSEEFQGSHVFQSETARFEPVASL